MDGDLGFGVEPVDLEMTTTCDLVQASLKPPGRGHGRRAEDGPAVDPDVPGRLAVRPDQPDLHRGAPSQRDADFQGLHARPGVAREESMRILAQAAPLALIQPRAADHLELVNLARRLDC